MSQHLRTSHTYRQVQWHTSQTFSRTMIHVQTNIWQRHWSLSWSLRQFQGSESSHCLMTVTESQILLHLHKPPQWWHLNKIYSLTLLSTAMADESAFHALSVLSAKCTVNVNSYSVVTTNYYDPCLMSFFLSVWSEVFMDGSHGCSVYLYIKLPHSSLQIYRNTLQHWYLTINSL